MTRNTATNLRGARDKEGCADAARVVEYTLQAAKREEEVGTGKFY